MIASAALIAFQTCLAGSNRVEMPQRGAMGVVDRAVAFIRDNKIEICVPESTRTQLAGNRLQCADDDLPLEAAPG